MHSCTMYIDDGFITSQTYKEAQVGAVQAQWDLEQSGFEVNQEKSHWEPAQRAEWLGFIADSQTQRFYVPTNKVEHLRASIQALLSGKTNATARALAQICGQLSAMELAIGPLAKLMSRSLARLCAVKAPSWAEQSRLWDKIIVINDSAFDELQFWCRNLPAVNGYAIFDQGGYTTTCYSDASDTGYAGYIEGRTKDGVTGS